MAEKGTIEIQIKARLTISHKHFKKQMVSKWIKTLAENKIGAIKL